MYENLVFIINAFQEQQEEGFFKLVLILTSSDQIDCSKLIFLPTQTR